MSALQAVSAAFRRSTAKHRAETPAEPIREVPWLRLGSVTALGITSIVLFAGAPGDVVAICTSFITVFIAVPLLALVLRRWFR